VRGQKKQFWPDMLGFKYKMSNVQAAIGCAQMERIDDLIQRKREIFEAYRTRLADLPIAMNPEPPQVRNGFWMPTVVVDAAIPFERDRLLARFAQEQIDGRVFFSPLSQLPMFEPVHNNNVAYGLTPRAINLPSYHDMSAADIDRGVSVLRSVLS
jgi:perosamine synthetase